MLHYIAANVDRICQRRKRHWDILELTGPYALGRVALDHARAEPASRIALLPLEGGVKLSFAVDHGAHSWFQKTG